MSISFNNLRNMNSTPISGYMAYYDNTTFTARSVSAATDLYADTAVAGHHLYFTIAHCCNKPRGMYFDVTTAMAGTGITITWEYRKADNTWASFAGISDGTTGFTVAGAVTWTVPTDWGTDTTSIATYTGRLWWRARISAATAITEGGRVTNITQIYDNAVRVDANHTYDTGTATAGAVQTLTNSGKAYTVNSLMQRIIYIHTGTGSGQARVIRSNTATVITIYDQWETQPSTDSQYVICANFEDLYQADVSGGWGVITKQGNNSYYFNCYLDFNVGAFGDVNKLVEFNDEYYFYNSGAATATYQIHLGWRLPLINDLDKGVLGNHITTNRSTALDSRQYGFNNSFPSSYIFTADNTFEVVDHNLGNPGAGSFLCVWFYHSGAYSINDTYKGWRSVVFSRTNPSTEVRGVVIKGGYSGTEGWYASGGGNQSYYNTTMSQYMTNSTGSPTFRDFYYGPNSLINQTAQDARFQGMPIQYFGGQSTGMSFLDYKGVKFRPMNDVYGSGTSTSGRTFYKFNLRLQLMDEYRNLIPNGRVVLSDSLTQNTWNYLLFDNTDDYVTVSNSSASNQFSGCTAFSVEAWVHCRTSGEGSGGRILDKGTGSSVGYVLYNNAGQWSFGVTTGGSFRSSNALGAINYGWHHLVGVYNGSTVKLYLNNLTGTAQSATGATSDDTGQTLYIGNRSATDRTFDGFIRRVRIFRDKALDATEVATLWNDGNFTQSQTSPVSGCTAEYNFTDGSGTTLTDSSGQSANGTLGAGANAPTWGSPYTGTTANSFDVTTGTFGEFLNEQVVTSGGSYSLSAQPSSAVRLRFVISDYGDATATATNNARIWIKGTDADGVAIQDVILLESAGNGTYYTLKEFKTVDSSGLVTVGWYGTMTVDRMGSIYPQTIATERWKTPDDQVTDTAEYGPFTIKMSAPGHETTTWKGHITQPTDEIMILKRSNLNTLPTYDS